MDYNNIEKAGFAVGVIIVGGALVVFGPLITIWAVNHLFGLSISYTFTNWFASLWLTGLLASKAIPMVQPKQGAL